jgi:drug/metabolite transporter (DMT)-like permease
MVTYLFPLGGVILGVTILHEQLTWNLIVGAILIVASLVVTNWEPRKLELSDEQQPVQAD